MARWDSRVLRLPKVWPVGGLLGGDAGVGLDPVEEGGDAGEGVGVADLAAGGGAEGGDAVGVAVQVQGAARVALGEGGGFRKR